MQPPKPDQLNRQIRLHARPQGFPDPSLWEVTDEEIPDLKDGEVLVQVTHISIDPAIRIWIDDKPAALPPVGLGEVIRALALGRVMRSRAERWTPGQLVSGLLGVQEWCVVDGGSLTPVDSTLAPAEVWLGALGIPGMTAYFGLLDVAQIAQGDTVVISGAAGGVGSIAGQIARRKGCRVIGIAGGPEKCAWLKGELGFDEAIDYKNEDVDEKLGRLTGDHGIDVYLDNVGGALLDTALKHLALGARVVISGSISQYNAEQPTQGPANYLNLQLRRASMMGVTSFDWVDRFEEAISEMSGWLRSGDLVSRQDVVSTTIDAFGELFSRIFRGENVGKLILQLIPTEE